MGFIRLSYGFTLACGLLLAGCVIPFPHRVEAEEPNFRPAFVPNLADPPFGAIDRIINEQIEFKLSAEDANLDDELQVALFRQTSTGKVFLDDARLDFPTQPDAMNPYRRSGRIPANVWCQVLGIQSGSSAELFVYVFDRPLPATRTPPTMSFDENRWTLTCQ